jgi:hypothetical protein
LILIGLGAALLVASLAGWVAVTHAAGALFLGAWPAFYLCERMGNRRAPLPRSVDDTSVDELSSFWERLVIDVVAIVTLTCALALALAGSSAIGRAVGATLQMLGLAT